MFQLKTKRLVAVILVVCMLVSNNGITVLAEGVNGVIDDALVGGSQVAPDYSKDVEEESTTFNYVGENEKIDKESVDDNIVLDEVSTEEEKTVAYESKTEEESSFSESFKLDEKDVVVDPSDFINDGDDEEGYEDEPEEDIESETEIENSTNIIDESETYDTYNIDETETYEEETRETEKIIPTEEAVEESKVETEPEDEFDIASSSDLVLVKEEKEKEYKIVKRYIKSTESAVVDDGLIHNWEIVKVLLNNSEGSVAKPIGAEELEEKYLAKTVKVLLKDQYGNERVVRVKADWLYSFSVIGDKNSEEYEKRVIEEYNNDLSKEMIVSYDDNTNVDEKSDNDENVENSEIKLNTGLNLRKTNKMGAGSADNDIIQTLPSKEENVNITPTSDEEINKTNSIEDIELEEDDMTIEDSNVVIVYEDEIIPANSLSEEDLEEENSIRGNANTGFLTEENADTVTSAFIDMEKLTLNVADEIKKLYGLSTVNRGNMDINEDVPRARLLGAGESHFHSYCGLKKCDGTTHLKYNQTNGTKMIDEIHEETNYLYLPLDATDEGKTTSNVSIVKGYLSYGPVALQGDWEIKSKIELDSNVFICTNGYKITFVGGKSSDYADVVKGTKQAEYGEIVVDTHAYQGLKLKFAICNCMPNAVTEITAKADPTETTNYNLRFDNPCINIKAQGSVYLFGLKSSSNVNNIKIKQIYQVGSRKNDLSSDSAKIDNYYSGAAFMDVQTDGADAMDSTRQIRICNVDAEDILGMQGGLIRAVNVNSFAMVDCNIKRAAALNGAVCNMEYNDGSMNENIILLGNTIEDCAEYYAAYAASPDSDFKNNAQAINSYIAADDPCNGTNKVSDDIELLSNGYAKQNAATGIISIHNYTSGQSEEFRQIKGNKFIENLVSGSSSVLNVMINSEKGLIFANNEFTDNRNIKENESALAITNQSYIDHLFRDGDGRFDSLPSVCANFTNSAEDVIKGNLNAYENKFTNNIGYNVTTCLKVTGMKTVYADNRATELIENGSIYTGNKSDSSNGAIISVQDATDVKMMATTIQNTQITGNSTAGVMYFGSVDNVTFGNILDASEKLKVQIKNVEATSGAMVGAGAKFKNVKSVLLINSVFDNIVSNSNDSLGSIYYANDESDGSLEIIGSTFSNNKAGFGGALYLKNINVNTSYLLSADHPNVFRGNKAVVRGSSMYIIASSLDLTPFNISNTNFYENVIGGASFEGGNIYINGLTEGSSVKKNVILTDVKADTTVEETTDTAKGGFLEAVNCHILLMGSTNIKNCYNAFAIDRCNVEFSYSESFGTTNVGVVSEIPIIEANRGQYVFGFEPGNTTEDINTFWLSGGGILNNTLDAVSDNSYTVSELAKFNYGIFKSLNDRVNNTIKQKIYLTGGINITGNKSGDALTNIPLEQGANPWFDINMESSEHKLTWAARLAFLPLDVTAADGGTGAVGYQLFKNNKWSDIEGIEEGGSPQTLFSNDRQTDTRDARSPFVSTSDAIWFENESLLVTYEFDTLNHSDVHIAAQKVAAGSTVYKPFKPQAISESGQMLLDEAGTVRALDVMGRLKKENGEVIAFTPWDWDAKITINEAVEEEPTRLYLIYQLLNHKHTVCGNDGETCDHLDGVNHYELYDGYYGDIDNMYDKSHACVEVAVPQQLFYAYYFPEYMYVLTDDIVISEKIYGRDTAAFMNGKTLSNLKLCLNGHSITVENGAKLFTLMGDSYICDCTVNKTNHNAKITIKDASHGGKNIEGSVIDFVADESGKYGDLHIFGNENVERLSIDGFSIDRKNTDLGHLIKTYDGAKLYIENVNITNNKGTDTLIQNAGSIYFNNVDLLNNEIVVNNNSAALTVSATDNDDTKFQKSVALVKTNKNNNGEHFYKNVKIKNNKVNYDYSGIILDNIDLPASRFELKESEISNNTTGASFACVSIYGSKLEGELNIQNNTFNENVGGALYIKHYACQVNSTIADNVFSKNTITSNTVRLGGAAIAIEDVAAQSGTEIAGFMLTNNKYIENVVNGDNGSGGAIYLKNTQAIESENEVFTGNIARYGSSIYDYQADSSLILKPRRYSGTNITECGDANSVGTIYLDAPVSNMNVTQTYVNLKLNKNKGQFPGIYVKNLNSGNVLNMEGNVEIKENDGGPVIYVSPERESYHRGAMLHFDTDNLEITNNKVGSKNAIEVAGRDTGDGTVNVTTTLEFRGVVRIASNTNASGQDSNFRISKNVSFQAFNKKLNATKQRGSYRSYIGVNTTEQILSNAGVGEFNMLLWNSANINGFAQSGVLAEEVIVPDEKSKNANIITYKGGGDSITIGKSENCKEVKVYIDEETVYKVMHIGLSKEVYLDNFADGEDIKNLIPEKYKDLEGITAVGFIAPKIDQTKNVTYYSWNFNSDKYRADEWIEGNVYLHLTFKHGHTSNNTTHTSDKYDWILAYNSNLLLYNMNEKYALAKDLEVPKKLVDTLTNYTICLNGHSLSLSNEASALSHMEDVTKELGFNLINCKSDGIVNVSKTDKDSTEDFIKLASDENHQANSINITNIKFRNLNFYQGSVINIRYGRLNAKSIDFDTLNSENEKVYMARCEAQYIVAEDSICEFDNLYIKNIDTIEYSAISLFLSDSFESYVSNNNIEVISFKGDFVIKNNKYKSGNSPLGKDASINNRGFIILRNIPHTVKINMKGNSEISNNDGVGAIIYAYAVYGLALEGDVDEEGNPINKIYNNKTYDQAAISANRAGSGEGLYTFKNIVFKDNVGEKGGSAFQFLSAYNDSAKITFDNVEFDGNKVEKDGTFGGAVFVSDDFTMDRGGNANKIDADGNLKLKLQFINMSKIINNGIFSTQMYANHALYSGAGGQGGFLYARNADVTIKPKDGGILDISGNGIRNNIEAYTAARDNNFSHQEIGPTYGGVMYLDGCSGSYGGNGIINIHDNYLSGDSVGYNSMANREYAKTYTYGAAIFIRGYEVGKNLMHYFGGKTAIDGSEFNVYENKLDKIEEPSDSLKYTLGGTVYLSPYASFGLNGKVKIASNSDMEGNTEGISNLFAAGDYDSKINYETAGAKRIILDDFDYNNSIISATVKYIDDFLVENFKMADTYVKQVFKKDSTDETVNVYTVGEEGNLRVFVGNSRMPVKFILGPDVRVVNESIGFDQTTTTTINSNAITGGTSWGYAVPNINGTFDELNQYSFYGLPAKLEDPADKGFVISRDGYKLEGWVAYVYDVTKDKKREFRKFDFEKDQVLGYAVDAVYEMQNRYERAEIRVFAIWSNLSYNNVIRQCGRENCNHKNNVIHRKMPKWIEVTHQEALYYSDDDAGFYNEAHLGILDVNMLYGSIKAKTINISGMQKNLMARGLEYPRDFREKEYTAYGKNQFSIYVNRNAWFGVENPIFANDDLMLSVSDEGSDLLQTGNSGIYAGAMDVSLFRNEMMANADKNDDNYGDEEYNDIMLLYNPNAKFEFYGPYDKKASIVGFQTTYGRSAGTVIRADEVYMENVIMDRNNRAIQIDTTVNGFNANNLEFRKMEMGEMEIIASDSYVDQRAQMSLVYMRKANKAGDAKLNKLSFSDIYALNYFFVDTSEINVNSTVTFEIDGDISFVRNKKGFVMDSYLYEPFRVIEEETHPLTFISTTETDSISGSGNLTFKIESSEVVNYFTKKSEGTMDYFVNSYGASVELVGASPSEPLVFKNNVFSRDFVRVAHPNRSLHLTLKNVEITGNTTGTGMTTDTKGLLFNRYSPNTSIDTIVDAKIINNNTYYAYYNENAMNTLKLGGLVEIIDNKDLDGKQANLHIREHNSNKTIDFDREDNKLNAKSKIAVSIEGLSMDEAYVAYQTWTPDMRVKDDTEALDLGYGTTNNVFVSDDEDYQIYKSVDNSIKLTKKNTVEVHYEYFIDVKEKFANQYVAEQAIPDHPGVPVSVDNVAFKGWYTSVGSDMKEVNFDLGSSTTLKTVNNIATMYAIWDQPVKIKIHRNETGSNTIVKKDGTTQVVEYPAIADIDEGGIYSKQFDAVYEGKMGDSLDIVLANLTSDPDNYKAYLVDGSGRKVLDINKIVTYKRTSDVWLADGWWTEDGWNGGKGDGNWGNRIDPMEEVVLSKNQDYYVRWVGQDVKLNLDLMDYAKGDEYGSTEAALDEGLDSVDIEDKTITLHYLTTIDKLPTAKREGYVFKNWHTSSEFADTNIITAGEYLDLQGVAGEDTLYAEWEPIQYTIRFMPDQFTDPFTFATPTQVVTFDKVESLNLNRYTRIGYELDYWEYIDPVSATRDKRFDDGHMLNQDEPENLSSVSGDIVNLYMHWKEKEYSLTFALNDSAKGEFRITEGYFKGTTMSEDDEIVFSEEEGNPIYYGQKIGDVGSLPKPTRPGYTFEGWWTKENGTGTQITEDTTYDFEEAIVIVDGMRLCTNSVAYAKWEPITYTIKIDDNRYEYEDLVASYSMATISAVFDRAVNIPVNTMIAKGYTYDKLYFENDATGDTIYVENKNSVVTLSDDLLNLGYNKHNEGIKKGEELVLYAMWNIHKYTIEYIGNAPDGRELISSRPDSITTNPIEYVEYIDMPDGEDYWFIDGYTFDCWSTETTKNLHATLYQSGDSISKIAGEKPNEDGENETYKLYAIWIKNPYYIVFTAGEAGDGEDRVTGELERQRLSVDGGERPLYNVNGGNYTDESGLEIEIGEGFKAVGYTFDYWEDTDTKKQYKNEENVLNIRTDKNDEAEFEAHWKPNTYTLVFDKNEPISSTSEPNQAVGSNYYEKLPADKTYNPQRPNSTELSGQIIKYPDEVAVDLIDSQDDPQIKINGYIFDGFEDKYGVIYNAGADAVFSRKAATRSETGTVYDLKYRWKKGLFSIELKYNDTDTSPVDNDTKEYMKVYYDSRFNSYEAIPEPTRNGYNFNYWTFDRAYGPTEVPPEGAKVSTMSILRKYNSDPTNEDDYVDAIYAYWTPKEYSLTVSSNNMNGQDGSFKIASESAPTGYIYEKSYTKKVLYERPIGDILDSELTGYKFVRFDKSADGDEEEVTKDTLFWETNDNQKIYAIYEPITYKVKFNASASDALGGFNDVTLTYDGDSFQLPSIDETGVIPDEGVGNMMRKGYTFVKWEHRDRITEPKNKNTVNKQYYENEDDVINMAETQDAVANLYAMWKEHNYTIVFDPNAPESASEEYTNNVSGTMKEVPLKYTDEYKLPTSSYSVAGYKFLGWDRNSSATTPEFQVGQAVSKLASSGCGEEEDEQSITLYAIWEANVYNITLNLNDASNNNGSTTANFANAGQSVNLKIAYDSKFQDAYVLQGADKVSQNVGMIFEQGDQTVKATRDGYRFMGWSKRATLSFAERANNLITADEVYRTEGDITIYATWENNEYTFVFETNTRYFGEGLPENPVSQNVWFDMPYGQNEISGSRNLPDASSVIFNPYTFGGWYLRKDADWDFTSAEGKPTNIAKVITNTKKFGKDDIDAVEDGIIRLYAYWGGTISKIIIDANGGKVFDQNTKTMVDKTETTAIYNLPIQSGLGHLPAKNEKAVTNDGVTHDAVERKGYTFEGWYTWNVADEYPYYADLNKEITDDDPKYWNEATGSVVHAKWTPKEYKVDFVTNLPTKVTTVDTLKFGTWEVDAIKNPVSRTYKYDESIDAITSFPQLEMEGWTFEGWYTKANATTDTTGIYVSGKNAASPSYPWQYQDINRVYGQWKQNSYVVTWDVNKGDGSTEPSITSGRASYSQVFDELVTVANVPTVTRDGYIFDGFWTKKGIWTASNEWDVDSTNNNGWGDRVDLGTFVYGKNIVDVYGNAKDATFYARWIPKQFTITFNGNKGSATTTPYIGGVGTNVQRIVMFDDTLDVYRDTGSIRKANGGQPAIPTTYTVNSMYDSNVSNNNSHYYPNSIDATATIKEGYTFLGWFKAQDGTGDRMTNNYKFTSLEDMTIYAKWEANKFRITYFKNDNSDGRGSTTATLNPNETSKEVTFDEAIGSLPEVTREGYDFLGWWTKNEWNDEQLIKSDRTFDALWGTSVKEDTKFNFTQEGLDVLRDGVFQQWPANISRDITLYARYARKTYNIIYKTNAREAGNGSTVADILVGSQVVNSDSWTLTPVYFDLPVLYGNDVTLTDRSSNEPVARRVGYEFTNWTKASDGGEVFSMNQTYNVTTDTELYAQWRPVMFKIKYDSNIYNEVKAQPGRAELRSQLIHSSANGEVDTVVVNPSSFDTEFDKPMTDLVTLENSPEALWPKLTSKDSSGNVRQGYDFTGYWSKPGFEQGVKLTKETVLNETFIASLGQNVNSQTREITIYPNWKEHKYKIEFVKNITMDGATEQTMPAMSDIPYNSFVDISDNTFTEAGFEFVGWNETAINDYSGNVQPRYKAVNGVKPQVYRMVAEDNGVGRLYATWKVGQVPIVYKNATISATDAAPAAWNKNANTHLPYWFNMMGNTDGGKVITAPVRKGFRFTYWELPDKSTTSEPIPIEYYKNERTEFVLKAHWEADDFYLSFNPNGGNGVETTVTLHIGENYTIPDFGFSYPNRYIAYWSTSTDGRNGRNYTLHQTIINAAGQLADTEGGVTLYAIWAATTQLYRVNTSGGGGGGGGGGGRGGGGISIGGVNIDNNSTLAQVGNTGVLAVSQASNLTNGNWQYDPVSNKWLYQVNSNVKVNQLDGTQNNATMYATNGIFGITDTQGNKGYYAFDTTGAMITGLYQLNGKIYYFAPIGNDVGKMQIGWQDVGGGRYSYFGTDGAMLVNTVTPDGYRVDAQGTRVGEESQLKRAAALTTGAIKGQEVQSADWVYDQGSHTYKMKVNGTENLATNGFYTILVGETFKTYRFNNMGTMQTGMVDDGGYTYYLNEVQGSSVGEMRTGMVSIAGNLYYFNENKSNGVPYGALMKNATLPNGTKTDSMGRVIY